MSAITRILCGKIEYKIASAHVKHMKISHQNGFSVRIFAAGRKDELLCSMPHQGAHSKCGAKNEKEKKRKEKEENFLLQLWQACGRKEHRHYSNQVIFVCPHRSALGFRV